MNLFKILSFLLFIGVLCGTASAYTWSHTLYINVTNPSTTDGVQVVKNFSYSNFSELQSDWRDINFTKTDDITEIPYFIINKSDGNWANICLKLPANDTRIKVNWGNSSATSTSNASAVYDFDDEFTTSMDWTKWQSADQSKYTVSSGEMVATNTNNGSNTTYTISNFSNCIIESRIKPVSTDFIQYFENSIAYTGYDRVYLNTVPSNYSKIYLNNILTTGSTPSNNWYNTKMVIPASGDAVFTIYSDDFSTVIHSASGAPGNRSGHVGYFTYQAGYGYVDFIRVSKYISTPPTLSLSTSVFDGVHYYVSPYGTGDGTSISTPGDASKIAASLTAGQTAYFLNGTYPGNIIISNSGNSSSPITLKAYNGTPTLQGSSKTGDGIKITGDYITIDGLNITNYNRGIDASGASHIAIKNNSIVNNYDGIYLTGCDGATIKNNSILGNLLLNDIQDFENGLGSWTEGHGSGGSTTYIGTGLTNDEAYTGSTSYKFACQGIPGSYPQAWIKRSYSISSPVDYLVSVEGYTKSGAKESAIQLARATTSISSSPIPYISYTRYAITGYYGTDWKPGIFEMAFNSSIATFYVMLGIYPSETWTGYLDDVRVLAFGTDTHNGITILNSQQPLIQNNTIQYLAHDGMYIDGCSSPKIDRDTIKYVSNDAVNSTLASSYTNLTNSTIYEAGNYGALLEHDFLTANNNTISFTYKSAISNQAVYDATVRNTHSYANVTNNTIFFGQSYTAQSSGSIVTGKFANILNNSINFGTTGIKAETLSNISNNMLGNISSNYINIEYRQHNISITNNTLFTYKKTVGSIGMRLKMLYNSVIEYNAITDIETGIGLQAYNSMNSEKNIINSNIITGGGIGIDTEDICDDTITNNKFSNQTNCAIQLQGPIYTWTSFRNGIANSGTTDEYVLPSPFGIVNEILSTGYTTPGLTTLWTSNLGAPIKSTPATYDNVIYIVTNGTLYAINNNDGTILWSYNTNNIYPASVSGIGNVLIHSSPSISGANVYFGSGNTLYAVTTSGSLLWSYQTRGQVISSPQVYGANVYAGSTDGYLYAINAATGALVWSYNLNDAIVATPCIYSNINGHAGITAKGYNGSVAEVLDDGTAQWTMKLPKSGGWASPGLYSTYLYLPTAADGTGKSSILVRNVLNGVSLWSNTNIQGNIIATPTINGGSSGLIDVETDSGANYLFALTTGTPNQWTNANYGTSGFIGSPLAYAPGLMSIDRNGKLYRDYQFLGNPVGYYWIKTFPMNVSSSLVHSYGKLFVCGENGVIYALVPVSNVTISGNNISNASCGASSFSTEANVTGNTFTNVAQFVNYTQMFSRVSIVENNTVGSSDITIDKKSFTLAKDNNKQNVRFKDIYSKYGVKYNNISLITSLSTPGTISRNVPDAAWNQSYAKWKDTSTFGVVTTYKISGLKAGTLYSLKMDGAVIATTISDSTGSVSFTNSVWGEHEFTLLQDGLPVS